MKKEAAERNRIDISSKQSSELNIFLSTVIGKRCVKIVCTGSCQVNIFWYIMKHSVQN